MICCVLITKDTDHPFIKKHLDKMGVVSQFMLFKNIQKKVATMGVMTNLVR